MRRPLRIGLVLSVSFLLGNTVLAQDLDRNLYRTFDGTYNNLQNPEWGSTFENLLLITNQMGYSDGISAPGGINRPNPRDISNDVFAQDFMIHDPLNLSDFTWVFGQFIDHDIGLTPDGQEDASIAVPAGDSYFDPRETGTATIAMHRNVFDQSSGTGTNNPRRHPNVITAYIDGSAVYGSDEERADWLRTFEDGKLKVSEGNLLPFNTVTGEFYDEVDPEAPEMDNPVGLIRKQFVAGDVRANENPLLLSFHTVFVREHNLVCDELKAEHPDWGDEELYQHARKIVGGKIQSIVYNEWLPTIGVDIPEYDGYDSRVHGQLFNSFTAAAYRMGHTLLNANLQRVMNDGSEHPEGALPLRRAFFNPLVVMEEGGIDPLFKGMGVQIQQSFDQHVVNDVRNFLFGPPGSPGLDLASININRGRERGVADFNSIRVALGLEPYELFRDINSDQRVSGRLLGLYRDVDDVDSWVAMLAEDRVDGSLFGETVKTFMELQFRMLRDGDRFFFENDPVLSDSEKKKIRQTTMHDVLMRNTDIKLMQSNVFEAMPHNVICDNMIVDLSGRIWTEEGNPVSDVVIDLLLSDGSMQSVTSAEGNFQLASVPGCFAKKMTATKSKKDFQNGVTTFDMVLVQKHILRRSPLTSPYKILAADVDLSGSITTLDLIKMRRVILSVATDFGGAPAWRFVPADHVFSDPTDPFADEVTSELEFDLLSKDTERNYIAIKLGDLNGSALTTPSAQQADTRTLAGGLTLLVDDQTFTQGSELAVTLTPEQADVWTGWQFGLTYNPQVLEYVRSESTQLEDWAESNVGVVADEGRLLFSWHDPSTRGVSTSSDEPVVTLYFKARQSGDLRAYMNFQAANMQPESYRPETSPTPMQVLFSGDEASVAGAFRVDQNQPNPFAETTTIRYFVPQAGQVTLTVSDAQGRIVLQRQQTVDQGEHQFELESDNELAATGIYQYQVQIGEQSVTRQMIRVNKE